MLDTDWDRAALAQDALADQVFAETAALVQSAGAIDLATLYRTLRGLLGELAIPHIPSAISRLVRDCAAEVQARTLSERGPVIGVLQARLRLRGGGGAGS